jgi:hypothetical protein
MSMKQVFVTPLTDDAAVAGDALGDIRMEGNSLYKYVKFSGTTVVAIGDVCCYVATDTGDQTVDGANTAFGAGVAMAAHGTGSARFGWIQIKGLATLSTALAGTPAVGDSMTTAGATAPAVTKVTAANSNVVCNVVNVAGKIVACDFNY